MRKFLINAALAVGSVVISFAALEGAARLVWPTEDIGACYADHPRLSYVHRPNCERRIKLPESERVTYRYNSCGNRGGEPCGQRASTGLRLAFLGDSFTHGDLVDSTDSYPSVAGRALSAASGGRIEVHNLGVSGYDLVQYWARLDDALALDPRFVIVGLLPNDLFLDISPDAIAERFRMLAREGGKAEAAERMQRYRAGLLDRLRLLVNESRLAFAIQHFLFLNRDTYVRFYLVRNAVGGYLSKSYSPEWEGRLRDAERLLGDMAARTRKAGGQLVILSIPQRVQAAMMASESLPEGFDPEEFGNRVKEMGRRIEAPVVDFLDELKRHPQPEKYYFPVDGHLTPAGQRLLGNYLAQQLRSMTGPGPTALRPSASVGSP